MTSCIKSWQSFFLRFFNMTVAVIIYARSLQWVDRTSILKWRIVRSVLGSSTGLD